jgi:hypothetical protein
VRALTVKLRELRHEAERLRRRAVQRTRRVVLCGQLDQLRTLRRGKFLRQELRAQAVAKRVAGLETALAGRR